MDGAQLVQWLSVQASNMVGELQHNVRALMVRGSSPMPVSDGHDEVASLRKQLRHQQQAHRELQTMLKNQALAIEPFQSKCQMAGQEAHAFMPERVLSQRTLYVQSLPVSSGLKIVFSVSMMVNFDHMFMLYKTNVESILARRRIRCVRDSSMLSLNNPACVKTNCNKL